MSTGRVLPSVRQKLIPGKPSVDRFGLIQMPRTREEKIRHIKLLESIPLEMASAVEESSRLKMGNIHKRSDPISHILVKYQSSASSELVRTVCRACASSKFDLSLWTEFEAQILTVFPELDAADCGLLLKCLSLYQGTKDFGHLKNALVEKVCHQRVLGNFTILYAVQSGYCSSRQLGFLLKLLFAQGLEKLDSSFLISLVRAWPNNDSIFLDPIVSELVSRPAINLEPTGLFVLLTSLAKKYSPSSSILILRMFTIASEQIFENDQFVLQAYSIEQLVGLANAFATVFGITQQDRFGILGNELVRCNNWTPRLFATCISAFGRAAVLHEDLALVWQQQEKMELTPRQIAMSIDGLNKLGILDRFPHLLEMSSISFDLHSISRIVAALGEVTPKSLFLQAELLVCDEENLKSVLSLFTSSQKYPKAFPQSLIDKIVTVLANRKTQTFA